jgi:3-hydroxyacyl-[acyl-carrier-protein] dehydratase
VGIVAAVRFELIDSVLERSEDRLIAVKRVSRAEEYLQDHFPTFPVLPGVMMLEAMVQAGRALVSPRLAPAAAPLVLGGVRALKYGRFVTPGASLRVEVSIRGEVSPDGACEIDAKAHLVESDGSEGGVAASGRLALRPARRSGDA